MSITLLGLPGWQQHIFFLGNRLQQVNTRTGRARTMRRIIVIEEGRAGGWASRPAPEVPEGEVTDGEESEAF
jgi:hypothetical protein